MAYKTRHFRKNASLTFSFYLLILKKEDINLSADKENMNHLRVLFIYFFKICQISVKKINK